MRPPHARLRRSSLPGRYQRGWLLAVLVLAAACAHTPDAPRDRLRVATWNILYLNRDLGEVVRHLQATDADVLALQEVTPEAWQVIEPALAAAWPHRSFDGEFALFSRRRLGWVEYVEPAYRRRGAQIAWLEGPSPALLANIHLEAQVLENADPASVVRTLERTERVHLDELKHLLRRLEPGVPHIILGDLNSMPAYGSHALLRKRGYVDVADATHLWPATTWADDIFGVPFWLRIDYVYVTSDIVPLASQALPSEASDHHLLWAELALPPGPSAARKR